MATVASEPMTVEAFSEWASRPENAERRYELDRGRVVEVSSPKRLHGLVNWLMIAILTDYVRKQGGFLLTHDTGILVERNPDTLRGPDIMMYLRPLRPEDMTPTYVDDIPDLIVEVLSPDDRQNRTLRRVAQYHTRGIPLVWVVEPEDRTITIYRPGEFPKVLDESDDLAGNGVLPEFRCRVADLFPTPGTPAN